MAKSKPKYKRVAQLKTLEGFTSHLKSLNVSLPIKSKLDKKGHSSLAQPLNLKSGKKIGNRFCILPMEGWDGTAEGLPTDETKRRWHHFAISGAKLLWGCEAVAVRREGRANPNQLLLTRKNLPAFKDLYSSIIRDHEGKFTTSSDLCVGLQLTHSGRFCAPDPGKGKQPKILYHHPVLDKKFDIPSTHQLLTDAEIDVLVSDFVQAADLAHEAGFHFVDIKHCHGYLGHEFLSALHRNGKYGGDLKGRTHFLRKIVEGIKASSNIPVGVRLSAYDFIPFSKNPDGIGVPDTSKQPYSTAFGCDETGLTIDLTETIEVLKIIQSLGIELVCITAGSPYYVPHIQRPALFPPSDGYLPPEDPLVGVARMINTTTELKKLFPDLVIVGSGYSYLQEWLAPVAEAVIDQNHADMVGLGRLVLSYPDFPKDVLEGNPTQIKKFCRTFSDCTTAPRHGMVSGCYPLDPYYKKRTEAVKLKEIKGNLDIL